MKGNEVIPQGDVLVTDNRIAAVGKRGLAQRPAGTRTINVAARPSCRAGRCALAHVGAARLHQTEVWQYLANLAYGVTTTRDPQTSTPDVFAYADMVDSGMMPGPRIYATGPGVFRDRASTAATPRSDSSSATRRRIAPTPSSSKSPAIASSGSGSSRRARNTASRDDRRLARSEVEPDADGRRLPGRNTASRLRRSTRT